MSNYGPGGWPPQGPPPPPPSPPGAWPAGPPGGPYVPFGAPPGAAGGGGPQRPGASSNAVIALVLAIVSWFMCGCFTSLPAIYIARSELGAIERGESSPAGKELAQAAFWIAVVNAGITVLLALVYAVLIGLGVGLAMFGRP